MMALGALAFSRTGTRGGIGREILQFLLGRWTFAAFPIGRLVDVGAGVHLRQIAFGFDLSAGRFPMPVSFAIGRRIVLPQVVSAFACPKSRGFVPPKA